MMLGCLFTECELVSLSSVSFALACICCCWRSSSVCRSSASCVSEDTTAMRISGAVLELRRTLPKMNSPMMTGIMTVVMRNPRVRMRSKYSRCAISQTLRMETAPILGIEEAPFRFAELVHGEFEVVLLRRFLLHVFDKDLLECRLGPLEGSESRRDWERRVS